jgi:hypothetical protein
MGVSSPLLILIELKMRQVLEMLPNRKLKAAHLVRWWARKLVLLETFVAGQLWRC